MSNLNKEELLSRITVDANLMVGKPVIHGMRITVEQIMDALAGRLSDKEIIEDYTELEVNDIKAVLLYANELVKEERVYLINH